MMVLSNNIIELAKATWRLFCLYPGLSIVCSILVVIGGVFTYYLVKGIFKKDWRGPVIL